MSFITLNAKLYERKNFLVKIRLTSKFNDGILAICESQFVFIIFLKIQILSSLAKCLVYKFTTVRAVPLMTI